MKYPLLTLALTFLLCRAAEAAGPFRCEGKLIEPGVPAVYVLAKCGMPQYGLISETPVRTRTAAGFSRLSGFMVSDQWIYDRGPGRFPAVLIFRDGRLRRIEYVPERS